MHARCAYLAKSLCVQASCALLDEEIGCEELLARACMQAGFNFRAQSAAGLAVTKAKSQGEAASTPETWPCDSVAHRAESFFCSDSPVGVRASELQPCTWLLLLRTFARSDSGALPQPLVLYVETQLTQLAPDATRDLPSISASSQPGIEPPCTPQALLPAPAASTAAAPISAGPLISSFEAGQAAATAGSALATSCADLCSLLLFAAPGVISAGATTQASKAAMSAALAFFLLGAAFRLKQWANVEELVPAVFHALPELQQVAWDVVLAKARPQHKRKVVERLQGKRTLHLAQSMSGGGSGSEGGVGEVAQGKYKTLASAGLASVTVPREAAAAAAAAADPALGRAGNIAVQRAAAPRATIHFNVGGMKPWAKPPKGGVGGASPPTEGDAALTADVASAGLATDSAFPRQGVYRGGAVSAAQAIRSAMPSQWTRKGKEEQRSMRSGEGVRGGATARQPYGSAVSTIKAKMGARAVAEGPAGHKRGEGGALLLDMQTADRVADTLLDVVFSVPPQLRKVPGYEQRTLLSFLLEGIRDAPANWNGKKCSWSSRLELPWAGAKAFTAALAFAGGDLALQRLAVDTLCQGQQLPLAAALSAAWRLPERLCSALGAEMGADETQPLPYSDPWLASRSAAVPSASAAAAAGGGGGSAAVPKREDSTGLYDTAAKRVVYPLEVRDGTLHAPFVVFHSAAEFLNSVPGGSMQLGHKLSFDMDKPEQPILPEHSLPVLHVASASDLQAFGQFMQVFGDAAAAQDRVFPVGVDVEWRPAKLFDETMPPFRRPGGMHDATAAAVHRTYQALAQTSSLRFPAALLQVATPQAVFIIDVLAVASLGGEVAALALGGSFLAHTGILKLGFGLQGDFAKIAGSHRDLRDVFSSAATCLDLPAVFQRHSALRSSGAVQGGEGLPVLPPSAMASDLRSLTVACCDVLGAPLAKDMQTSDWQQRPLSIEQVRYGAMDALSLLSLFAATTAATSSSQGGYPLAGGVPLSDDTWWMPCVQTMTVTEAELAKQAVVACDLLPILRVVAPDQEAHATAVHNAMLDICGTPCASSGDTPADALGSDAAQRDPVWLRAYLASAGRSPCRVCQVGDAATAQEAAAALGVRAHRITKSLAYVVNGDTPVLVVMPGSGKVDTGKLAAAVGGGVGKRKVKLATALQCAEIYGYTPGTFPPFGHSERVQIFVDESVPRSGLLFGGGGSLSHCVAFTRSELEQLALAAV